jgi:hypothetical protein
MQSACALFYCHLRPVRLYQIFPHYLIIGTIQKKVIEHNICVLISSAASVETFLILIIIERDNIINYVGRHVKYHLFLSDFNDNLIFSTDFRQVVKYKI